MGARRPRPRVPHPRALLSRDRTTGQIAVGLVGALLVSALVYGVGMASAQYKISDVGSWLTATAKGMVVHVNGLSGKVDGKTDLPGTRGHKIRIVQDGRTVLLVDDTTGVVSRIDPSQLKVEQSRRLGVGLQIVAGAGTAYSVDRYKGTVQQIDPFTLATVGQPAALRPPLGRAALDQRGTLWVPAAGEGRLVPFQGGRQGQPVEIAGPSTALGLSIVAGMPVAVDSANAAAVVVRPEGAQKVKLPGTVTQTAAAGGVRLPAVADSLTVPLLGRGGELTLLDTSTGGYTSVALRASRHTLGEPQILGSKVYIPDETAGSLLVYDSATRRMEPHIPVSGRPGPLDVFVKDGLLWANDPNGDKALSIDSSGSRKPIRKYEDKVPGGPRKPLPDDRGGNGGNPGGDGGNGGGNDPVRPPRMKPNDPPLPPQIEASGEGGKITVAFTPSQYQRIRPEQYVLRSRPVLPGQPPVPAEGPYGFQIDGLKCGKIYAFQVGVVYTDPRTHRKRTRWSPVDSTPACAVPGAPEGLSAQSGDGFINVSFNEGAQTEGVKDYVLTDDSGKPVAGVPPVAPGRGSGTFRNTGLSCDLEYTYRVAARPKSPTAERALSTENVTKRPCNPPAAPVSGLAADGVNKGANLNWNAARGRGITYMVEWPGGGAPTAATSYSIANALANNTTHRITVTPKNGAGTGPAASVTANLAYVRSSHQNKANNQTNTIVRPGPKKEGQAGSIPRGEYRSLTLICQVYGQSVTEEETGETSNVWNRIEWQGRIGYLSVTLMEGPRAPGGKTFECAD
ncbi:hypothetical protein GCM10009678_46290 [Actinomadura kijaniata]|uniref:Fibronectin type-III domain-containing protein n=1 Tax=Actinomadura namibiensis TaxID=182080 RepID=A0A7W3QQS8_ACTNM|nr:hypothetical protein [Actinomadura namibiensis]MBA8955917.1 hypothetical protein [Actinomadura namibiensis]